VAINQLIFCVVGVIRTCQEQALQPPDSGFFGIPPALGMSGLSVSAVEINFAEDISMKETLMRLWRDEAGQDLTEYALLMVLVALAAVTTMGTLATAISKVFSNAAANLTTATT
jgi:pilus assembly protein Flp/PilA